MLDTPEIDNSQRDGNYWLWDSILYTWRQVGSISKTNTGPLL